MYVSCNRSRCPCCIGNGFVGLVAYHLLRQALYQPDSIQEMENFRNSCVGNGGLQWRCSTTSPKNSMIRPSEGVYFYIGKIPRHFITQRRRPVHIPNPMHPQREAGTYCPIPPNPYLAHKPASRHQPPMSKLLLAYPDQTRQSSPPTSERKGRSMSADIRSCTLSFGVACEITIPPLQCRGEEVRFLRMLFVRFHALLPRPRGWERKQRLVPEGTALHTESF